MTLYSQFLAAPTHRILPAFILAGLLTSHPYAQIQESSARIADSILGHTATGAGLPSSDSEIKILFEDIPDFLRATQAAFHNAEKSLVQIRALAILAQSGSTPPDLVPAFDAEYLRASSQYGYTKYNARYMGNRILGTTSGFRLGGPSNRAVDAVVELPNSDSVTLPFVLNDASTIGAALRQTSAALAAISESRATLMAAAKFLETPFAPPNYPKPHIQVSGQELEGLLSIVIPSYEQFQRAMQQIVALAKPNADPNTPQSIRIDNAQRITDLIGEIGLMSKTIQFNQYTIFDGSQQVVLVDHSGSIRTTNLDLTDFDSIAHFLASYDFSDPSDASRGLSAASCRLQFIQSQQSQASDQIALLNL